MIAINDFISNFSITFPNITGTNPWDITGSVVSIIEALINSLGDDYVITGSIAIHKTAVIEPGAIVKAPCIISAHCFIGANAYLRGGVYLASNVKIGAGCEIKTSIICNNSAVAHFNFLGDSIIGSHVNFEAGSVAANHYNERQEKNIPVLYGGTVINTGVTKFGALVGDGCKIGANAVLSPGTLLQKNTIVKRLQLVEQCA